MHFKGFKFTIWQIFNFLLVLTFTLFFSACGEFDGLGNSLGFSSPTEVNGTATLMWQSPITNEDGSPLHDLAGYRVYIGISSGNYMEVYDVGKDQSCGIGGLSEGTYYFAVTAYDEVGNESQYSNEVSKTIF